MTSSARFVIIGGVAAGASAAARARRLSESAGITLIERGPDVSFANCGLPYFIGGEIKSRDALAVQTPATLKAMLPSATALVIAGSMAPGFPVDFQTRIARLAQEGGVQCL